MTKSLFTSIIAVVMLFSASHSKGQNTNKAIAKTETATIQVIQFHSEHRCMTCNLIEKLTKETLQKYPIITFSLVNVDDKKNAKIAEQFEATGTALFLYNPKTGKKKELTDFAFMNAKSEGKNFKDGLEKEINAFK
ncbi:MAG: nitrophenyl compound nitroreductase subunit ArsF family protein [Arcicella sp.]|nr:nitrophenyl compound nitroreductase subunit ArsF family protein [Arcicella sp.]